MSAALEIRGATKSFGDRVVLDGVDLAVAPGSVTVDLPPLGFVVCKAAP